MATGLSTAVIRHGSSRKRKIKMGLSRVLDDDQAMAITTSQSPPDSVDELTRGGEKGRPTCLQTTHPS